MIKSEELRKMNVVNFVDWALKSVRWMGLDRWITMIYGADGKAIVSCNVGMHEMVLYQMVKSIVVEATAHELDLYGRMLLALGCDGSAGSVVRMQWSIELKDQMITWLIVRGVVE